MPSHNRIGAFGNFSCGEMPRSPKDFLTFCYLMRSNEAEMNLAFVPKNRNLIFIFTMAIVIISLVMGGATVYFFFVKKNLMIAAVLLGLGILLVSMFVLAWPSFEPVVFMNEEGISDRRLGVGIISWDDIEDVQIENRYNNKFICIRVIDPQKYVSRLRGPKLANMKHTQDLGFTMLNIDISSFDVDPLELMKYVRMTIASRRTSFTKVPLS